MAFKSKNEKAAKNKNSSYPKNQARLQIGCLQTHMKNSI
jgi:hypothetical protein